MSDDTRQLGRAAQIFTIEEADLGSLIGDKVWRTHSEPFASFTSVAASHWEMVVVRHRGRVSLTVRGPETWATATPIPEDAQFVGVRFRLGTFMPTLDVGQLTDRAITLPNAGRRTFWFGGSAFELPTFDNADVFVRRLVRKGLVVRDPIADAALHGRLVDVSLRTVQRRILRATGLTHATILQIARAHQAVKLLEGGEPILQAVERLGYADQPHLTRALRRFIGHTPAQIIRDRST